MNYFTSVFTSKPAKLLAILTLAYLSGLTGCSKDTKPDLGSELEMYQRASNAMAIGDFKLAVKRLEDLGDNYPLGDYALQGELDLIYAYYRTKQPDAVIRAANDFQTREPTSDYLDYTIYMQGIAEFERYQGGLSKLFKRDASKFNDDALVRPFRYFSLLTTRFPNSKYTPDARQRMIFLRNQLAESCMRKVKFYEKRKAYLSALKRAESCITNYDGAPSAQEALTHVEDNYKKLGLTDLTPPQM